MDKIKFLKDVDFPLISIGGIKLSNKKLQALIATISEKVKTVNSLFVFTDELMVNSGMSQFTIEASFKSNSQTFSQLSIDVDENVSLEVFNFYYDNTYVGTFDYNLGMSSWVNSEYSTIKFEDEELLIGEFNFLRTIAEEKKILSKGAWQFNSNPSSAGESGLNEYLIFNSDGQVYNSIRVSEDTGENWFIYYDNYQAYMYYTTWAADKDKLTLNSEQMVSEKFYNWFTSNANQNIISIYGTYYPIAENATWQEFFSELGTDMIDYGTQSFGISDGYVIQDHYGTTEEQRIIAKITDIITPGFVL